MESKTEKVETTTLVLNVKEREWLKSYLRNSPQGLNETPSDETMRQNFWSALGGTTYRSGEGGMGNGELGGI